MADDSVVATSSRLLVIDDEPEIAAMVGGVARTAGFDVIVTTDPEDFKQRVRSWRPAIIISISKCRQRTG